MCYTVSVTIFCACICLFNRLAVNLNVRVCAVGALTWHGVLRVDSAGGGEGHSGCVTLFVLLSAAVQQQQGQQ